MPLKRKLSAATKRKISLSQRGKKNSMYGKKQTRLAKAKLSRRNSGKGNPMYGRSHSAAAKRKISLKAKQRYARLIKAKKK